MVDWDLKGKVALVIVDMQHDIVGEGGKCEPLGFPQACKEAGVVPKIQSLLKAFREKKLPIVHVVAEYNPLIPISIYGTFNDFMRTGNPCATGSKGTQIIPELAPVWGEPVVRKWNIGIFSNSNLNEVLKYYGAETLVMVGVATNLAVHIGAVQATDHGYSVIVAKDAVTSSDKEAHEYTLAKVFPLIALVTTTEEILSKI